MFVIVCRCSSKIHSKPKCLLWKLGLNMIDWINTSPGGTFLHDVAWIGRKVHRITWGMIRYGWGTPKSSILIGFSIIFTIHFRGVFPLFLVQHPCMTSCRIEASHESFVIQGWILSLYMKSWSWFYKWLRRGCVRHLFGGFGNYIDWYASHQSFLSAWVRIKTRRHTNGTRTHGKIVASTSHGCKMLQPFSETFENRLVALLAFANAICPFLNSVKIQQADKMCLTSFATNHVFCSRGFSVFSRILNIQMSQDLLQKINSWMSFFLSDWSYCREPFDNF